MYCILQILTVKCYNEPRGANGLEGFVNGNEYYAMLVSTPKQEKPYYRIYHTHDYYETCGRHNLRKYFKESKPTVSHEVDFNLMIKFGEFIKSKIPVLNQMAKTLNEGWKPNFNI